MKYRHEWKHEIGYVDYLALRSRLKPMMRTDNHCIDGKYKIRSLYFDNYSDTALKEKLDGVNCRKKYRIRYYNNDLSYIVLERKSKIKGLCGKEQVKLTLEEVQAVLDFDHEALRTTEKPLLAELYREMCSGGLRPKTIVDYTREPFVFGPGNVRVTLDYDIRTGLYSTDFLNFHAVTVPAGDAPIILEVKWDDYLPSIVRDAVQVPASHSAAFSKYAACRIYG